MAETGTASISLVQNGKVLRVISVLRKLESNPGEMILGANFYKQFKTDWPSMSGAEHIGVALETGYVVKHAQGRKPGMLKPEVCFSINQVKLLNEPLSDPHNILGNSKVLDLNDPTDLSFEDKKLMTAVPQPIVDEILTMPKYARAVAYVVALGYKGVPVSKINVITILRDKGGCSESQAKSCITSAKNKSLIYKASGHGDYSHLARTDAPSVHAQKVLSMLRIYEGSGVHKAESAGGNGNGNGKGSELSPEFLRVIQNGNGFHVSFFLEEEHIGKELRLAIVRNDEGKKEFKLRVLE